MAQEEGEKITSDMIFADTAWDKGIKGAKTFVKELDKIEAGLLRVLKLQDDSFKNFRVPKTSKENNETNDGLRKSRAAREGLIAIEKERIKLLDRLKKLNSDTIQQNEEIKVQIGEQVKINRQLAREKLGLVTLYEKESKRLNDLRKKYKDQILVGKENTKQNQALLKEITNLDKKLKDADKSVGQFNRNIGNYKQDIVDAIGQTANFSSVLFDGVKAFRDYRKIIKQTGDEQSKFGTILKATGIGLAVLVVAALKKLADQFIEVSQEAADAAFLLQKGINFAVTNKAAREFIVTMQGTRKELRSLSKDLQDVNNETSDLAAIASDETISLTERNKALDKSIELEKRKADIEIKIARQNLKNAKAEVDLAGSKIGNDKVINELLVGQQNAENALSEAQDKRNDIEIESDRRRRKIAEEQTITNIELTRSQKLSANARQKELQAQLADERKQLDERRKIAEEINQANLDSIASEAKELEKFGITKREFSEFVATTDEIELKELVRKNAANIEGTAIEKILFKVVKEAQESRITNAQTIKKLDEEEISRTQRILELNQEIEKLQRDQAIHVLETSIEREGNVLDELGEKVLNATSILQGAKLNQQLKELSKTREEDENALFDLRARNLKRNAANQLDNINKTIFDEKLKAEEIRKISEQLNIDLDNLIKERELAQADRAKKQLEFQKELARKQVGIILESAQKITQAFDEALDKRNEKRKEALDKELVEREENITKQEELAAKGLDNQLAFELQKKKEAELERKQLEERQAKQKEAILLAEAYLEAFISELNQPNSNPATAAVKALADVLLAKTIGASLAGAFAGGVENLDGKGTGTSDSNLAALSKGESVITANATASEPGLATAWNKGKLDQYFEKEWLPHYKMNSNSLNRELEFHKQWSTYGVGQDNQMQEMNKLLKEIAAKPVHTFDVNKFGHMVETIYENGITTVINHKFKKPRIG